MVVDVESFPFIVFFKVAIHVDVSMIQSLYAFHSVVEARAGEVVLFLSLVLVVTGSVIHSITSCTLLAVVVVVATATAEVLLLFLVLFFVVLF